MSVLLLLLLAAAPAVPAAPAPAATPAATAPAGEEAVVGRPLPLPSVDGKPLATTPDQRVFRIPYRFAKVARFYRERFAGVEGVSLAAQGAEGARTLTVRSRRRGEPWAKAVVREGEVDTAIEVTPVLQLEAAAVSGAAAPLVELVLTRSEEAAKAADSIDHLARERQ